MLNQSNKASQSKAIQRAIVVLETTQPRWVLERSGMATVIADAKRRHPSPVGSTPRRSGRTAVAASSRVLG
jgi:hypothetical protein